MSTLAIISFGYNEEGFTPEQQQFLKDKSFGSKFTVNDVNEMVYEKLVMFIEDAALLRKEFSVKTIIQDQRLEDFGARNTTVINKKVDVAVPGLGLLAIDEVQVFTDECTERLQLNIEDGWRILAICPQPDQRRPDYIMGRTKNNK